jgi:uncharacterized protein (UPF0261 family)
VDFVGWQGVPVQLEGRPTHAHNRLLSSAGLEAGERRVVAQSLCRKLSQAQAPVAFVLPNQGCNEWDRPGGDLHDAEGLAVFCDEMRSLCPDTVELHELDCHINDAEFCDRVLEIFDSWVASGVVCATV